MKILRFRHDGRALYGVLEAGGDRVAPLAGSPFEGDFRRATAPPLALSAVELLPPTVDHPRIFGVGFNYKAHIAETGRPLPEIPPIFMKPDTALIGHGRPIVYPAWAKLVHYETELVVVIGRTAKGVARADARRHVLGYTLGNDVSERTYQRREMAMGLMTVGKAADTFAPIGPWIETELDPARLRLTGRLNGTVVQTCETSDLLFDVDELVAYLSTFVTLRPGDLVMTGTPGGVGPLVPGDTFAIEAEGIGTLSNPVVAEGAAPPNAVGEPERAA